jgi:hypothetical protein
VRSNTILLRSSRKCGLWKTWLVVPFSVVTSEPHWLRITVDAECSDPLASSNLEPLWSHSGGRPPSCLLVVCSLLPGETESSKLECSTWFNFPSLFPPAGMIYCWMGTENTQTSRHSGQFPQFSPSNADLSALFVCLTLINLGDTTQLRCLSPLDA